MVLGKELKGLARVVLPQRIQTKERKVLRKTLANWWIRFLKNVNRVKSRTAKSLPKYRGLAALFQVVFLVYLIERYHDNIPHILDSIQSESCLQRFGESEYNPFWSLLQCHGPRCFPLLVLSGHSRSTARTPRKRAIEHRMHGSQFHKSCCLRSSQQY